MDYDLKILNTSQVLADKKYLKEFKFANGKSLPYSYQSFAAQFGWGRVLDNYLIYIPLNPKFHDSWQNAREDIKSTYINNINEYIDYYPDESLDLMKRMEPFAKSESGYYLFWDIYSEDLPNEFNIYATDFVGDIYLLGKDLFEVFYNLTNDTKILKECFNRAPWPKTFEGFMSIC